MSAEVVGVDTETMVDEGTRLAAVHPNIAVKVPLTPDGLKTCRALSQRGVMVNVTLCFSANQALLAAKAGARFISPFIGRLDDIATDGASGAIGGRIVGLDDHGNLLVRRKDGIAVIHTMDALGDDRTGAADQ